MIPERGETAAGGRVRGHSGNHPSPFKDDPLPSVFALFKSIATTPLFFLRGVSMGEARVVARGMAAMGAEGAGVGAEWAESTGAEGAEAPATPSAPWRWARASANLALFSSLSTMPAPR